MGVGVGVVASCVSCITREDRDQRAGDTERGHHVSVLCVIASCVSCITREKLMSNALETQNVVATSVMCGCGCGCVLCSLHYT